MSGVNPSIGNQIWWNNPASETGNQSPQPAQSQPTTPPGYRHQSGGWTHVNAVPIPPGEVAQQSTQQANAGRGAFDRMVATQQSYQAESSAGGQSDVPLPAGVYFRHQPYRDVKHPASSMYSVQNPTTGKNVEAFNANNKLGREVALATRRELEAGRYKGKDERPKRINEAKRKGDYAVVLQYLNDGCPDT